MSVFVCVAFSLKNLRKEKKKEFRSKEGRRSKASRGVRLKTGREEEARETLLCWYNAIYIL